MKLTITRLSFLLMAASLVMAQGCNKLEEPEEAVDNSGAGSYNPANCILANDQYRCQLLGFGFEFDYQHIDVKFDEYGRPVRFGDKDISYTETSDGCRVRFRKDGTTRVTFTLGSNGFAKTAVDDAGVKFKFSYDADGHLIYGSNDCDDSFTATYKDGNMTECKVRGNNSDGMSITVSYTSLPNFGYMPYGFCKGNGKEGEFMFDWFFDYIKEGYLIGILGKPSANLPSQYVEEGSWYATNFINQYWSMEEDNIYYHHYGWSSEIGYAIQDWRDHPDGK